MTEKGNERLYTIPLRSEVLKVSGIEKSKRAVKEIKMFLFKHMKASDVKVSQALNSSVWVRGVHKPPSRIRIRASMDKDGIVTARLPDEKIEVKEEKKSKVEQLKGAITKKGEGAKEGSSEAEGAKPKEEGKGKEGSKGDSETPKENPKRKETLEMADGKEESRSE